jgi:hypothetical protein
MYMFDSLAQLRAIDLLDRTLARNGPARDCGWPVRHRPVTVGILPAAGFRDYVVDIGYVTGVAARLHMEVAGHDQAVYVQPGVGHAYFVVDGLSGPVRVRVQRRIAGICVADVTAGRPWPRS